MGIVRVSFGLVSSSLLSSPKLYVGHGDVHVVFVVDFGHRLHVQVVVAAAGPAGARISNFKKYY
jgi:hypothetical protein